MSAKRLTCIICPQGCQIDINFGDNKEITKIEGHRCGRGKDYVTSEIMNPVRVLTALVRIEGGTIRMCPVRTRTAVTKDLILDLAKVTCQLSVKAPIKAGDVIVRNILGTNTDLISSRDIDWVP